MVFGRVITSTTRCLTRTPGGRPPHLGGVPHRSRNATPVCVIVKIETCRRKHKWSARWMTDELAGNRIQDQPPHSHPTPDPLGLGQRRLVPRPEQRQQPQAAHDRRPLAPATWHTSTSRRSVESPTEAVGAFTAAIATKPRPRTGRSPRAPSAAASTCTRSSTASPDSPTPSPWPTRRGAMAAAFPTRGEDLVRSARNHPHPPCDHRLLPIKRLHASSATSPCTRKPSPARPGTTGRASSASSASSAKNSSTPESSPAKTSARPRSAPGTSATTTTDRRAEQAVSHPPRASEPAPRTSSPPTPGSASPASCPPRCWNTSSPPATSAARPAEASGTAAELRQSRQNSLPSGSVITMKPTLIGGAGS